MIFVRIISLQWEIHHVDYQHHPHVVTTSELKGQSHLCMSIIKLNFAIFFLLQWIFTGLRCVVLSLPLKKLIMSGNYNKIKGENVKTIMYNKSSVSIQTLRVQGHINKTARKIIMLHYAYCLPSPAF